MDGYQTKTERAAHVLREAITKGEIRPGNRIQAEAFGESIGLSATPIREAMRQLEAEGIVEIIPHRGAFVTKVSRADFIEVYRMRGALESLAVRLIVEDLPERGRVTLADAVQKHQDTFRREVVASNESKARIANRDLHFGLYSQVGARLLGSIINLWAVFPFDTLWLNPQRPAIVADEHDAILLAVREGRVDDAADGMKNHIEGAALMFLNGPAASDYFTE